MASERRLLFLCPWSRPLTRVYRQYSPNKTKQENNIIRWMIPSAPPWTVHSLGQPRALSLISCPLSHLAVGLAPFRSARASALWQAVARNLQKQLLFRGACPLLRLSRKGQETTDSEGVEAGPFIGVPS